MRAEHIDWQRGLITITGTGNKQRLVAPPRDTLGRLHAYVGMFPEGAIWLSQKGGNPLSGHQIRKIIYEIGKRAGVDEVHPHRFRSAFATQYLQQFRDIQALQGVLGYESIETTAVYPAWIKERRGLDFMRQMDFAG